MKPALLTCVGILSLIAAAPQRATAQRSVEPTTAAAAPTAAAAKPADNVTVPADYRIGAGDSLNVVFWREPDLSADVVVRPDGKITLPLLKDVAAAGLTPAELEVQLTQSARQFIQEPNATVVVRDIKSRQVFITGMVARPGSYPLNVPMTVLQFIAHAGGLLEYAHGDKILIMRSEAGRSLTLKFNYKDITNNRNVAQNVLLRPGDTVIVP
jgi:polysaccharide biosynthesis/export protein